MTTFVIVHGAWSGGHAWKWVRPLLRSAGHEVFTPALTGLGERSHLASAQVDLETHVRDVIAVLEYEDLREVVLVGHSYGGMVISGWPIVSPNGWRCWSTSTPRCPWMDRASWIYCPRKSGLATRKQPDPRGRGG